MTNKVPVGLEVRHYTVKPCFVQLLSQLFVRVLENIQHQVAFSRPDRHGSGSHFPTETAQHMEETQLQCYMRKGMLQGQAFRHVLVSEDDASVRPCRVV